MWLHAKSVKQRADTSTVARRKELSSNPVIDVAADAERKETGVHTTYDGRNLKRNDLDHENSDSQGDEKDEQSVVSAADYPACGYRLLINVHGDRVTIPENQAQPLPEWDISKAPECVLRVSVTSADRSSSFEVRALFSIDTQITSVSETLANKLGLKKKGVVICSGLGCTGLKAYLLSRHVDITCLDVVHNHSESRIPASTRMALLIVPHAGYDLVLGLNWYEKIKSGCYCVLDFATDQARIHFLPKGKDARDKRALRSFSCVPVNYSNYIEASWGRPDPGPSYNADPDYFDKTHFICPDTQGQSF